MNSERLKMIDLFSGAGGLSEGLSEAGFHSLFASEIVPVYAQTYKKNHPHTNVFTADIRTLDANEVRTTLGIERGELDLIAGGPPCQGFSINAPVRTTLDERNHLFKEYLRFVDAFAPRAVLIENVPGLVSFEHGATLHAILDALAELGYGADVRILGAPYYGVPQMRWRTIILGVRGRALPAGAYPEPIYHAPIRANFTSTFDGQSIIKEPSPEANANFVTVYEAIGDLPPLVSGEQGEIIKEYRCDAFCDYQRRSRLGSVGVMNHEAPRLSPINLKRLEYIQPGLIFRMSCCQKECKRHESLITLKDMDEFFRTGWHQPYSQNAIHIGERFSTMNRIARLQSVRRLVYSRFPIILSLQETLQNSSHK